MFIKQLLGDRNCAKTLEVQREYSSCPQGAYNIVKQKDNKQIRPQLVFIKCLVFVGDYDRDFR